MDLVSKPKEYAKKYLEPRSVYILVKVVGDESDDSNFTYVSLLDSAHDRIKFSGIIQLIVTNPTFRQRAKVKGKGDLVKEKIEETPVVKTKTSGVNKVVDKDPSFVLEKKDVPKPDGGKKQLKKSTLADIKV